ncbi:hypothetical protein [Archangium primigenium]|uniref:hypothetical protein n=1 Tax=[Archangium] primigenium TaxID=2792470 RepID=UPI00195D5CCC|nr:hypothetical protein [Archangium primigenium]MBM7117008.1 hypothetical protein [Archangium primigenium]
MTSIDTLYEQLSEVGLGYVTLEVPPRPAEELQAPEALARAADEVPRFEPERRATGRTVSALYAEILGATVVEPPREVPPHVASAREFLYTDAAEHVPTRAYQTYLTYKQAYDAARAAGRSGEAEWRKLQTAQPGRIEAALATLSSFHQGDVSVAFASAQKAFAAGQRQGEAGPYLVCNALPPHFWAPRPDAEDTGEEERPFTRVLLERPWLRMALLSRGGWSVPGRAVEAYSNGRGDDSNTGLLALIPIALFIGWQDDGTPLILGWDNLIVPPCPPRADPP